MIEALSQHSVGCVLVCVIQCLDRGGMVGFKGFVKKKSKIFLTLFLALVKHALSAW